jgi:hypothetical protein
MDLRETGYEVRDFITMSQDKIRCRDFLNKLMSLRVSLNWGFLGLVSDNQLLKENATT